MLKVFFVLFILFLTTGVTHAQINLEIVDTPEEVSPDKEFSVVVEIAASSSSTYYIKVRAGASLSSLRSALPTTSPQNLGSQIQILGQNSLALKQIPVGFGREK